ncbi:SET domain-containing protein [Cavenderia fasciculata]|uniref:SET domain-containing protein n=1 Tax=Cavenderia fasciculata TaxID=261658 RepID=F4Q4V9_CACFS|nr:SET domain-containing protein [Cavenderia fasciculata]EGG17065.1 SET domain-containing protein [Cavenderia fasciculata]|eukprot:XP_004355549.1 SET domain-containing protein [Cavenderia fasciculata]
MCVMMNVEKLILDNTNYSISIQQGESTGRFILSRETIQRGSKVISLPRTSCHGIYNHLVRQVCHTCLKHSTLGNLKLSCQTCKQVYYCSRECQDAAERGLFHNHLECLVLRWLRVPAGFTMHQVAEIRMVVNHFSKVAYGTDDKAIKQTVGEFNRFPKEDSKLIIKMSAVVKRAFAGYLCDLDDSHICEVLAQSNRNSFGLWKSSDEQYGLAMYATASFLNHSCFPNCARVQRNAGIDIVAIRDIEENDEITICYINARDNDTARRMILKGCYYFDCQCIRCDYKTLESKKLEISTLLQQSIMCTNPKINCCGYFIPNQNNQNNNNFNNNEMI